MHRPSGVVWFERIIIATLVLGVLNSWLAWPQLVAMRGPTFALTVQALTLAVMLGLTLFVSRRRSNIAKWILIALTALGLPILFQQLTSGQLQGALLITLTQTVSQIVAFALLFTPASRQWFKREPMQA
jgi:hypothetical protein